MVSDEASGGGGGGVSVVSDSEYWFQASLLYMWKENQLNMVVR